jgi:trimethylamine:corrinoid methyltransferase-like protein
MNALPMKESIEELLEKENPEQTEKEKTEALQELEIYFCKTPAGRRIWRKKGSSIKRFVMSSSA